MKLQKAEQRELFRKIKLKNDEFSDKINHSEIRITTTDILLCIIYKPRASLWSHKDALGLRFIFIYNNIVK